MKKETSLCANSDPDARIMADIERSASFDAAFMEIRGQESALQAAKEYLFGIRHCANAKGTGGTLFLMGAPAVGKTIMAEAIAKGFSRPYMRVDMSSYNDKESYLDLFGLNPSYNCSQAGLITSFVVECPVSVLILDEIERCHRNVRARMLQILERGEIYDLYLKKAVSFRDVIIIFTSNIGHEIYDRNPEITNFSRTPFPTILHALKTEVDPEDDAPYFSDAFVSRIASGRILLLNKLRPETLHCIATREIARQETHFRKLYGTRFELDRDALADLIIYAQGAEADIRCILKGIREFFERHFTRLVQLIRENGNDSFFRRLACDISFDDATEEAKKLLLHRERRRILVMGKELQPAFATCNAEQFEILSAEEGFDTRSIGKLDLSAVVIAGGQQGAREVFLVAVEQETLPVYVVLKRGSPERFYYVDQGATVIDAETFAKEDLPGVLHGIAMSAVLRQLFRRNCAVSYEVTYTHDAANDRGAVTLGKLDVSKAFHAEDTELFLEKRAIPNVTFDDVIGADEAKEEMRSALGYMADADKYRRKGLRIPRGMLLSGPPGTGKTLLAKALAAEAQMPFIERNATQFLNRYQGEGARAVREAFRFARKYAPCIMFIDEIDVVARSRFGEAAEQRGYDDITNAFLSEMDGFADHTASPVFVVAATNFSIGDDTELDKAFLRRFDRRITIGLPNAAERREFLRRALAAVEMAAKAECIESIVKRTVGSSLSDLDLIVQNAFRSADETENGAPISAKCLSEALERFYSGKSKSHSEDATEKTAYHEAGHAVCACLLGREPAYVTITARAGYGGYFAAYDEGVTEYTRSELYDRICVAMAGRACEVLRYGEEGIGTGASSDIRTATEIALKMICEFGMDGDAMMYLQPDCAKESWVRERANGMIKEAYARAKALLEEHSDTVEAVVKELLKENGLEGKRILAIVKGGL